MPEVVTIGESMIVFSPRQNGPLRYVSNFQKRVAGSESNVAVGLVRLGHSCGWISKLGRDEFGACVKREILAEGVDVSRVGFHETAPTGIFFKEIWTGMDTRVYYYRAGSAASFMSPDDLESEYIAAARILHITGITPALSETCLKTLYSALEIARKNDVIVSFDPNIRLKLWSRERAGDIIRSILPYTDIVLSGVDEGEIIFGTASCDEIIDLFLKAGIKTVALKMGAKGCIAATRSERHVVDPFKVESVVDTVGAGDAFDAGFLAGVLEGRPLVECAKLANAMGAFAVTTAGDIDGLPQRDELEAFINGSGRVYR